MKTMTFQSVQKSRGCEEFGPSHIVYTDVVREDGMVEWSVKGTRDGEYVNKSGIRSVNLPTPLCFERIREARERTGWLVVEE